MNSEILLQFICYLKNLPTSTAVDTDRENKKSIQNFHSKTSQKYVIPQTVK